MPRLLDVIDMQNILGEGPLWNAADGRLWWTDIHARRLHRLDVATRQVDALNVPERIGSFAFVAGEEGADARVLAAFESGVGYFRPASGEVAWLARPEAAGTGRRFNDGRVDRQGRFWVASMIEDSGLAAAGTAALYRLAVDGSFERIETGVQIGNGLCVSPDGGTLYFADSPRQVIHAYALDQSTGALSGRRLFAQVPDGYPDGAAIDAEGCLWSARWGAGTVVRHAPDGRVLQTLRVPVTQPTCVAFGGEGLRLMFVTSATEGLSAQALADDSAAGALLVYECEVPGLAGCRYG